METEELRPFVLNCIKNFPSGRSLQVISLINQVIETLIDQGYYGDKLKAEFPRRKRGRELDSDREKIREIMWELIIQGVLLPGVTDTQPGLPFLTLTDYGKQVVALGEIQPHDPDGYLTYLKNEIPTLDAEIERYITESLQAYRRGLLLSSAVTMGVASEKAFILLHEELTNSITDPVKKKKFQDLQASYKTKEKFDKVKKELMSNKSKYPRKISENLETHLDTIFQVIRVTRNEVGHPTGKILNRGEVFVRLQLFVEYTKIVYQLIDWLQFNPL